MGIFYAHLNINSKYTNIIEAHQITPLNFDFLMSTSSEYKSRVHAPGKVCCSKRTHDKLVYLLEIIVI